MKMQSTPIEIFVADDQEAYRKGLATIFKDIDDFKLAGEAENGADLLNQLIENTPDVILMDIQMPVMDGVEATKIITKKYPRVAVIAMSVFDHEYNIIQMLLAGAKGFVSKSAKKEEFAEAVRTVFLNSNYFDRSAENKLSTMIQNRIFDPVQNEFMMTLTARETEVLRLICMQKANRGICLLLDVSIRTVEDHRNKLFIKTKATNIVGLVMFAMKYGLYDPEQDELYLAAIANRKG